MEVDRDLNGATGGSKLHAWKLSSSSMTCFSSSSTSPSLPSAAERAEQEGLRRVRDAIPTRVWVAASISLSEKAAFWGMTAPWQNYMQHPQRLTHDETPGALGLGQSKATRIYCAFYIAYYVSPMLFASLSDSRLGRYRTLLVCLILFNIGCAAMTISSLPLLLSKGWGLPGLIIAMICVALGGGGFEAVMAAFLADQYAETGPRIKTLKSGEDVITDRSLTIEYIYNLNYWLGNVGSLSWFAVVALEEHVGFTVAYGLTLGFIFISLVILLTGKSSFLRVPHETKIFAQASRILVCAARNGFRLALTHPKYQLEHRHKVVTWSGQLVNELRRGLQGCRVLLAFIMFYICFDQMQNNLISQSAQMETGSTPNDMLPAMNQVGCIVFTPLIHHVIYPMLHKRHIYMKPITRIIIGFVFAVLSMAYAAIVQHTIYSAGPCYKHPRTCSSVADREPNHVDVWLQAPVFFLIAMGEIWAYVTALEIAYSHAPKHLKCMIQAIFPLMAGIGSVCAMGLTPFAHDPNLVIFYASLAGGMAITTIVFWFLFRKYDDCDSDEKIGDSPADPQKPLVQVGYRQSTAVNSDLLPASEDVELGPVSAPEADGSSVLREHFNHLDTDIDNQEVGSISEAPSNNLTPDRFSSSPYNMRYNALETILSGPQHSVQRILSPRSSWEGSRKLPKRQPRDSATLSEPLPFPRLSLKAVEAPQ